MKKGCRKEEQEKAILKFCTSPKKNKEIKLNVVKRQNTLSELLKGLQSKGLLNRTVARTYLTTQEGVNFLAENGIVEENSAASVRAKIRVEHQIKMPEPQNSSVSLNYHVPFANREIIKKAIEGFLYLDEGHEARAKAIIEEVEGSEGQMTISNLFHIIGDAVAETYGFKKRLHENVWWNPKSLKETWLELKASLDFNVGISLRLNGRSLSDTIPWKELLESAIQHDAKNERARKRAKNAMLKNKIYRKLWVEKVMCHQAIYSKLYSAQNIIADSPIDLENIFIQRVKENRQEFPMTKKWGQSSYLVPKNEDMNEVLAEMKRDGTIRIKQVYTFEIDEKKLRDKEDEILQKFHSL